MNAKRAKVTAFILELYKDVTPGDLSNHDLMNARLSAMNDAEFEAYIKTLKPATTPDDISQRGNLPLVVPNLGPFRISIANNFKVAKRLGRSLTHRLVITDPDTGLQVVTPHSYPVLDLPVRRQAQTVAKKSSIPEHDQRIDDLTNQPISQSKGSRQSSPELAAMASRGLDKTIMEFINTRGGNQPAYREMVRQLIETGSCTAAELEGLGMAKSTKTAATLIKSMMLGTNLDPSTPVPEDALTKSE